MSLQVCHCGWSKVTTYHGLRTHQGKMGCTPKGMGIPESSQLRFNSYRPSISLNLLAMNPTEPLQDMFPTSLYSNSSSYRSLQVHQGNVGLTPRSMTMQESEQSTKRNDWDQTHLNRALDFNTGLQSLFMSGAQPAANQNLFAVPDATVQDTKKLFFETPPRSLQTTTNSDKTRRALDFFTGAQQVSIPTTTAQLTVVNPKDEETEKARKREIEKKEEDEILLKARRDRLRAELRQKIKIREHKKEEVNSSLKACKASLDAEWVEINNVFSDVMKTVEDARQKALQPLEERRKKVKDKAQQLVEKLENEVDELKKTIDQLDKNPEFQVCPPTGLDKSKDWKKVKVDTSFSFGSLKTTTSAMMKEIQKNLENLSTIELRRISKFAVDIKLDPDSAHQCLDVSNDGKNVRDGGKIHTLPDAPGRFDSFASILALNCLTSGKSYWEVEVINKTGWDLGVARGRANRKGVLSLNPDNGYWVTVHYEDANYAALTAPPLSLSLKDKPGKVGVFVDYEEGLVSFYDVMSQSHIYSFTGCSFSGEIFPYFSPHLKQNGKNSDPLIISTVKHQK